MSQLTGTDAPFARSLRERMFLLRSLPEGLTRASAHLQVTDHFLIGINLHLRCLREPATNWRAWKLRQKLPQAPDNSVVALIEMELTRAEHQQLLAVGSREVRFNRYQYQHGDDSYDIDFFMGDLLGVILAKLKSPVEQNTSTSVPPFAVLEVTHHPLFAAERLAASTAAELRAALANGEKNIAP